MPDVSHRSAAVLAPVRATFRAVARTVVPELGAIRDADWQGVESIVEGALAERPPKMRRQLVVFIRLIDAFARLRHRRRFAALEQVQRIAVLDRFQNSPILLLRRGFWGLRTLVYMGWYAQPETARRIGYQGHIRGWPARPGVTAESDLPDVPAAGTVGPLPPR